MAGRNALTGGGRPRRISRAPVYVTLGGLALAVALVLLGARMAAAPAPTPNLDRPGTADTPRDVNVILRDYLFNPSAMHLVAGEVVRLHVINGGLVEHELVLGQPEVQTAWARAHQLATPPAPFATAPPASVPSGTGGLRVILAPGGSAAVTYAVPLRGDLAMMCHLPGHVERGMVGQVILAQR